MRSRPLCVLAIALAACDSAEGAAPTLEVDSAGIPITTALAPVWGSGQGWTVVEEPVVRIGAVDGPDEYLLGTVSGTARLGNGDIVVGEWTSGVLRRYDREGVFLWGAGGSGEGPGEHRRLDWLGVLAGDSIVTWDDPQRRAQVFGPDGRVARTLGLDAPWPGFAPRDAIAVWGRLLVVTYSDLRETRPVGLVRWPNIRVATVSLDDETVTGLIDVPNREEQISRTESGVWVRTPVTFARGPVFAADAGALAVVDTEAFSIRRIALDDGSTSGILRRDKPSVAVTEEHVEGFLDWMAWRSQADGFMSEAEAEAQKPFWRERPTAPTLPVLRSIRLDLAGNLWVAPYSLSTRDFPPFEVYTPEGVWLGAVRTPRGLDIAPGEIGEDYILGVWRDELNVEYVHLHRLEK